MSGRGGGRLVELLRAMIRAQALEEALAALPDDRLPGRLVGPRGSGLPRPVSPAVPAAFALRRATDGTGDLFSLRAGAPGAALLFGLTPTDLLRQALGRAGAAAAGRDAGPIPTDLARGLLGPVSPAGALVEVMAGVALALRFRGEDRVALLVDDADDSASGYWHEGLNFAAVQRAPFVLVIDATRRSAATARVERLADRAPAYGISAHEAPADDPAAVLEAIERAVARARRGETRLVEVGGAPSDALDALSGRLQWAGDLEPGDAERLADEARAEVEAAVAGVLEEAEPAPEASLAPVSPQGEPVSPRPHWVPRQEIRSWS